jgi:hypothetical protein
MSDNPISVQGLTPRELLGVAPSASDEEIRGSFRLLAKVIHPDVLARGAGLFQVAQAAQEAALRGNGWPDLSGASGGYQQGFPPGVPTPPSPPVPPCRAGVGRSYWRTGKKGGWYRKEGADYINVYLKSTGWHWAGPGLSGASMFSEGQFPTADDAMADADDYFGPSGGRK